jgi:hypothetical protein
MPTKIEAGKFFPLGSGDMKNAVMRDIAVLLNIDNFHLFDVGRVNLGICI